ncbi:AAA family ATPase [Roseibium algicola]|uniref:AAA family ATPase n=1 Tax=Roseibium algicola TaxID=2857014 RepID=UPI003458C1F2
MQPPSDISFDCGLDAALYLIDRGLSVFPLKPDRRNPGKFCPRDVSPYENTASTRDDVHKLFGRYDKSAGVWRDRGHGVGIDCGNLVAIDLDNKDGKNGSANFASLVDGLDLETPRTLKFRTPTGGEHLVYRASNPIRNSAGKLAEGVDTRGRHGYLATIGTERADGSYTIADIAEIADCPEELEEYIRGVVGSPRRKDRKARDLDTVVETPETLLEAAQLLQETETDEYGGYNDTMYRLAARLGDMGLAQETTLELFEEFWLLKPAHRELKPDEIDQVIENAYRYRADPVGKSTTEGHDKRVEQSLIEDFGEPIEGAAAPEDDFDAVEDSSAPKPEKKGKALPWIAFRDVDYDLETDYLVDELLDSRAVSVWYGPSNTGKSVVLLDLCHAVATGREWIGRKVRQGAVVYLAAEAEGSAKKRFMALKEKHGKGDIPFYLIPNGADYTKDADVAATARAILEIEEQTGDKVELLVVDTLSQVMAGMDENSTDAMMGVFRRFKKIVSKCGCHVLAVHHTGKDESKGARGASALQGAVDSEVEVKKGLIVPTKLRDHAKDVAIAKYSIEGVRIGTRSDGKDVTAPVAICAATDGTEQRREITFGAILSEDELAVRENWGGRQQDLVAWALHLEDPNRQWTFNEAAEAVNRIAPGSGKQGKDLSVDTVRVTMVRAAKPANVGAEPPVHVHNRVEYQFRETVTWGRKSYLIVVLNSEDVIDG